MGIVEIIYLPLIFFQYEVICYKKFAATSYMLLVAFCAKHVFVQILSGQVAVVQLL